MNEDFSWISVKHNLSADDEFEYIIGKSSINLECNDGNQIASKKIGYLDFHIYNTSCFESWYSLIDAANSISGDEVYLMEILKESEKINFGIDKILCLDTIKIEPEYRRKGYGVIAMEDIIKFSRVLGLDYIILQPSPIEGEKFDGQRDEKIERIKQYYEKFNFELYSPDLGEPIMLLKL